MRHLERSAAAVFRVDNDGVHVQVCFAPCSWGSTARWGFVAIVEHALTPFTSWRPPPAHSMSGISGGQNPTDKVVKSPDWSLRAASDDEDVRPVAPAGCRWLTMVYQRRNSIRLDLPIPGYAGLDVGSVRYEREIELIY